MPFDWHTSGTQAPERLLPLEPYAKEERANRSESTRLARVEFLRLIPLVKPECLEELWRLAFVEFVCVVTEIFQAKLIQTSTSDKGFKVFSSLLAQTYFKIRNDGLINKSIGDLLCRTFSRFHAIDSYELEKTFPSFNALGTLACAQGLRNVISFWSRKWNLDAEWCRDHAVITFRELLASDRFKWSFLNNVKSLDFIWREAALLADPETQETVGGLEVLTRTIKALETEESESMNFAWYWAAQEITHAVLWSRLELSVKVHGNGGDPDQFEFKWLDIDFVRPGFNQLKETQTQFRRRLEVEFRLCLNERERLTLSKILKGDTNSDFTDDLGFGLLQRFKERLDKHIEDVLSKSSPNTKNLVPTKRRPYLDRNLRWTIEYQLYPGKTLNELAGDGPNKTTVKRAIDDSLALLGLTKRLDAKQGRKRGSRNTYYDPTR